jgi:hypothetical protein
VPQLAQKREVEGLAVPQEGQRRVVSALTGPPQLGQKLSSAGIEWPQCWQVRLNLWLMTSLAQFCPGLDAGKRPGFDRPTPSTGSPTG